MARFRGELRTPEEWESDLLAGRVELPGWTVTPNDVTTAETTMGRPQKPASERYRTPARQLGRIPDDEWDQMQRAAVLSGKTLTDWAKEILLRNARRQLGE